MKYLLYSIILFAATVFTACGGGDNHTDVSLNTPEEVKAEKAATPDAFDASFADGMTETVYQYYLKLRTALVNSNAGDATSAAANMAEALGDDRPDVRMKAQAVADAGDLEAIRTAFADLTTALEPLFTEGITDGVMYKQYCPMAFDGAGGNWFSDVSDIRNPYYGDKMLKCGKVVAEIK
ncbi:DUF3347 domain-containing protein [Neolewinella persica]|uniref:DUF3347 domain-containing protein n=1 Tax=Neolewinella persica TaxID=70998 RepID=UPI00035C5A4D|nr:DUF3347 domain-containing protein [Neolewinella persica]